MSDPKFRRRLQNLSLEELNAKAAAYDALSRREGPGVDDADRDCARMRYLACLCEKEIRGIVQVLPF
jgi:hypothetical protein